MSLTRKPSDPNATSSVFPTYLLPSVPFRRKSRQSSTDSNDSSSTALTTSSTITSSSINTVDTTISPTSSNPFITSPTPKPISSASSTILPPTTKFLSSGSTSHSLSRLHCARCSTDLCLTSQIISKGFTGRHGKAYLVQGHTSHTTLSPPNGGGLPNTFQLKAVPRNLVTGQHVVSDVSCAICGVILGWKYVEAAEESQKYKVGKYILETMRIRVGVEWDGDEADDDEEFEEILPLSARELKRLNDGQQHHYNNHNNSGQQQQQQQQEVEFDSQDEDECEDLFAGVWSPQLALKRRLRRRERYSRKAMAARIASRSDDTLS